MITRVPFRQAAHGAAGGDPAGLGLALAVARAKTRRRTAPRA
jgi:hypothetical protein